MKKLITLLSLTALSIQLTTAQTDSLSVLEAEIMSLKTEQQNTQKTVTNLAAKYNSLASENKELSNGAEQQQAAINSLQKAFEQLEASQKADKSSLTSEIQQTNEAVTANQGKNDSRTTWFAVLLGVLVVAIVGVVLYFIKRGKKDVSSLEEIRAAQKSMQEAQTKLQESSVKLDNQMLELIEKLMNAEKKSNAEAPAAKQTAEVDHSLALKVADEIVRIELNLSRMDSSIKGYKQLSKAVERIKNSFQANGYEIVDMLGKPYNEGMKVVANFVPDETLKEGEQIITGVTKPQVNYNGKMIQSAQITVSQNI